MSETGIEEWNTTPSACTHAEDTPLYRLALAAIALAALIVLAATRVPA